ncbi:type II toxin-antitoxin system RelE/ParE family toxin [bacterium]|nr:type II toxin-antitoxin system RelE/ParE family toxin [bacterium]
MKIIWSPQAREDLLSIFSHVAEDNLQAARKLRTVILSKIELLASVPHIGRPGRVPGTRELIIDDAPYIIPYRCREGSLEIVRVYHSSRKWPDRF